MKPTFRCRISPKYSRHIRRVNLAIAPSDKSTATVELLIIASCLPCVDTLDFGSATLPTLYDCHEDSAKLQAALQDDSETSVALRTLLSRTKHLLICNIKKFYQWHPLLSLANPHLSSLALNYLGSSPEELTDATFHLLEVELQRFARLSKFSVSRTPMFTTLLEVSENPSWRLRHLKLDLDTLADPYIRFIASFATTLETLELETDDDVEISTDPPLFSHSMPALTNLLVIDCSQSYQSTPANLTPSLRHLTLRASGPHTSQLAAFLPQNAQKLPTLLSLTFSPRAYQHPILSHRQTAALAEISNLRTSFERRAFNPMLAYESDLDASEEVSDEVDDMEYVRRRHGPIDEVIRFGARYNERLLNTQDQSGMDRLVEALRPLKLLQDFQED